MKNVMGIINLYEKDRRLLELTNHRPVAAIPFFGRYRIIDFALSNMTNSGITNVGVFIQEKPRPLTEHLAQGKWWELDGKKDGLFIFYPYYNSMNSMYMTEMKNFKDNIDYIVNSTQDYVIISSSYMLCNTNFEEVVNFHKKSNSDITVMYKDVNNANDEFLGCDVLDINKHGFIKGISINKGDKKDRHISMEIYIMKREFLLNLINEANKLSALYSLKETIEYFCNDFSINTFKYEGYLACINTIIEYYKKNIELLDTKNRDQLFKPESPIYTVIRDNAPAWYGENAKIKNSVVSNGALIEGTVENSIIARGVKVAKGAVVKNSILMSRCTVGSEVYIDSVIADKNTKFLRVKEIVGSKEQPVVLKKNSIV
ncbi:glucose-1-phosphate adenylyltransferase subunit GlgD [Clostridium sp.]|uniref:glucose-1-phosphate adenylyltransferase subunit GlgD n=1 Tax=Clostridium sp. TaxID=1506 RepID=UPI0032171E4A